jgi:hypothetical protein
MLTLFLVAIAFDGGAESNQQIYGRMALPYQYISKIEVTPSCFPQEKVVGRTISISCIESTALAAN